ISSGQSLRNGNSVEPGLPNTFRIPNARNRLSVASLTVSDLLLAFGFSRGKADNPLVKRWLRVRYHLSHRESIGGLWPPSLRIERQCFALAIALAPGEGLKPIDRP